MYSRVNWKHDFLTSSEGIRVLLCDGVAQRKVIPLLIRRPSVPAAAEHAALVRLFNAGLIPRIFVSVQRTPAMTPYDVISRLRVTFPGPNVIFSALSSRQDRTLICVSSSNVTSHEPQAA